MSLNESIVEDAALAWFGEQIPFAHTLTPVLSQKDSARRRLNPAIPEELLSIAYKFDLRGG